MQTEAYQNNVIQGFYATPKAESTALPLFWPSLADNFCPFVGHCAPSDSIASSLSSYDEHWALNLCGILPLGGFWSCSSPGVHGSWRYILDFATDSHITLKLPPFLGIWNIYTQHFQSGESLLYVAMPRSIYCSLGILQNSLPELSSRSGTLPISNQSKIGSSLWQWDLMWEITDQQFLAPSANAVTTVSWFIPCYGRIEHIGLDVSSLSSLADCTGFIRNLSMMLINHLQTFRTIDNGWQSFKASFTLE